MSPTGTEFYPAFSATGFADTQYMLARELKQAGRVINRGEWQAQTDDEQFATVEIQDISFRVTIPQTLSEWQSATHPNLPWAEDHFQERISGIPYNPPPSHKWWPFAKKDNAEHIEGEKFSHTYPERFWPKYAGVHIQSAEGIRYPWGDLSDVIALLKERPLTRQAYLPVWFPEDTGAGAWQRVPCTLGYHFLRTGDWLKCVYYIRSCDFLRHFNDDVYMAGRLTQHISEQIGARPGYLVMHISSLHIFEWERESLMSNQPWK